MEVIEYNHTCQYRVNIKHMLNTRHVFNMKCQCYTGHTNISTKMCKI